MAFSVTTISDKERGIGSEAPTLDFVQLFVQRCQAYARREVLGERYDLAIWERRREVLAGVLKHTGHAVPEPRGASAAPSAAPGPSPLFRPLAEWTPDAFGVQHPMALPGESQTDLSPYIGRSFDTALRQQVEQGHRSRPRCVTLSGWSSAGKTRSAWWVVTSTLPENCPLARPDDARALLELLQHPVPDGAVIFLDDAAEHLGPAHLHEVVQGLAELLGRQEPVVLLVTLDPATLGRLTELTGDPVEDRRIQRALDLVARTVHEVPDELQDLSEARQRAQEDPYLRHALAASDGTGRLFPMLTGGPLLVDRHERLSPHARALVTAAGECRRLGHGGPLPDSLLKAAALAHLDERQRAVPHDGWLRAALAEAERPVRGQVQALFPVNTSRAYGIEGYEVSPYLVNQWVRQADFIDVTVWQALYDHVEDGEQLVRLGHEAHSRAVYGWAYRYFTKAASLGYQGAATAVAWLVQQVGEREKVRSAAGTTAGADVRKAAAGGVQADDDPDDFMAAIEATLAEMEEIEGAFDPRLLARPGGDGAWFEADFGVAAKDVLEELTPTSSGFDVLGLPPEKRGALYRRLWDEMEGVHGSKAPDGDFWLLPTHSWLVSLLRAMTAAHSSVRNREALVWALENKPDADSPANMREREEHLRVLLGRWTSSREVVRRLQTIAAQRGRWSDVDKLTSMGGRYELETAAELYERFGLHTAAEQLNSEIASEYADQRALIEFWWRVGRRQQSEAALRRHIVAGNRHSVERLITMLRETGREAEAGVVGRSGLEPDGSTAAWTPPPRRPQGAGT
ncbi:ATP-binding protein [Streptomyces prunicolor]|uniref:ATP-binding protein n=1 Tax=Streptomyces prunicolor TaxID=67348 RepID=UPI00037918F2|nr:ATP-binding protein [Streptomyces prunicolor]